MGKFVKRPTTVEAYQWLPNDPYVAGQLCGYLMAYGIDFEITNNKRISIWVEKSNKFIELDHEDWMIVEPDGEGVYPCVRDVFEQSYMPAENGG